MEMTLDSLKPGQSAVIKQVCHSSGIAQRLRDLGLLPGTAVKCTLKSPSGNPKAYLIRGSAWAIRAEDSAKIAVNLIR
jgi:ferrous iron transport protein A